LKIAYFLLFVVLLAGYLSKPTKTKSVAIEKTTKSNQKSDSGIVKLIDIREAPVAS